MTAGVTASLDEIMTSGPTTGGPATDVSATGVAIQGSCWFECGQPATQNMGNSRYPKLVCGPCRACSRAMSNQINGSGNAEVKKTFHGMVRNNPSAYKSWVRSARIATTSDMPGVNTLAQRESMLSRYTQRIVSEVRRYRVLDVVYCSTLST